MKFLQKFMLPTGWFTDFDTMMICHLLPQWHWHFGYLFRQLLMSKILNLVLAANSIWVIPLEKDLSTCYHSINETGTGSLLLVGWQVLCSAPFLFYFLYYVCLLPWFLGAHLEFRLLPLNWKNQSLLASGSPLCSDPLFMSMTFAQVCSSPVPLVWPHPAPWTSSAAVVEWCDS